MKKGTLALLLIITFLFSLPFINVFAEKTIPLGDAPPPTPPMTEKPQISSAEALGNGKFRIGNIVADTIKKEIQLPGRINMVDGAIEFIASIKGGFKLYESILELDTNAYEFNLSLILIGLDQKRGKASRYHFDPNPPEGDPVEIWIEWSEKGVKQKAVRAENLVLNSSSKATMPHSHWVYTGSTIMEDGIYLAQAEGVLISYVHDPAAVIDFPSDFGLSGYGMLVANKNVLPSVGTKIQLKVKALARK